MKCRLCDGPTAGIGKLCADCSKALKRARARSSALRTPPRSAPDQVEAGATSAASSLAAMSVLAPGWRRHVVSAAAVLIAIGGIYFAQSGPERYPAEEIVVERAPASVSVPEPSAVNAPAVAMSLEAPSAAAPSTLAQAPVAVKTGAKPVTASTGTNRESKSPSAPSPSTNDTAGSKAKGGLSPEQEASPSLARAGVSPSAPTTDTGQSFASALEKCGNEGLLTRFICEQKMYMQYCEDKWDKDPRCVRKTATN